MNTPFAVSSIIVRNAFRMARNRTCAAASLIFTLGMTAAYAGVTTTTITTSSTTLPTLITTGNLISAFNFGSTTVIESGITFTGYTTTGAVPSIVQTSPIGIKINGGNLANDPKIAPDPVFGTEVYTPDQGTITLTITGLNPAMTYNVQFLHGDTRGFIYNATQTYTDSNGISANPSLLFGGTADSGMNYVNQIVTLTNSTSLMATMPNGIKRGPSFSGLIVSGASIPEPNALLLLIPGAMGLLATRAKRRRTA